MDMIPVRAYEEILNMGFFLDSTENTFFSVGYLQDFKLKVDTDGLIWFTLIIPWGKRKNGGQVQVTASSSKIAKIKKMIQDYNVPPSRLYLTSDGRITKEQTKSQQPFYFF